MSQLQVTGEAKIRDIQGPVVANDGVITALDGAASQYVRGDGTLADFPTSSGGGSSVSYYLNSSVSQGTIGGVAYRELSKEPIIGAGTDIPISANGYVASYLTDANDPDVVIVPGGNFNCEFYFSVNNNTGNPTFYAELYKYDGTTFTLLGTSAGVPESINQGTTIAPYYFAIPVATAALSVTDRLAIRIYVNVDGRTVTLHTENGHLCQVVTTLSKGMVSLNNLTDQSQFLTVGTSGTNFNIVSSGDTHTFNIPNAGVADRGLITNLAQTIGGAKTFSSVLKTDGGFLLKDSTLGTVDGYTSIGGVVGSISIGYAISSTPYINNLDFTPATSNTYTFPNASGTIALTSNLSSYVPYTGATGDVFLGTNSITGAIGTFTQGVFNGNGTNPANLYLKKGSAPFFTNANNYGLIAAVSSSFILISDVDGANYKYASFNLGSLTNNTNRAFTLPDLSGTLALLEGTQTFSGSKTFSVTTIQDAGIVLKDGVYPTPSTGYVGFASNGAGVTIVRRSGVTSYNNNFQFPLSSNDYNFPNITGTVALLEGTQTFSGSKTFSFAPRNDGGILLKNNVTTGSSGYVSVGSNGVGITIGVHNSGTNYFHELLMPNSTSYNYTFPASSGTIALASQIPANPVGGTGTTNYLPKFTGASTIGNSIISESGNTITINSASGGMSIGSSGTNDISWNTAGGIKLSRTNVGPEYALSQAWTGTLAYVDIAASSQWNGGVRILPNGGGNVLIGTTTDAGYKLDVNGTGRFSGALTGTSATFSGSITSNVVNNYGLIFNRAAVTNYNGIAYQTANVVKWYIGMRENLSSDNYIIYNQGLGTDTLTLSSSTGAATFSSDITIAAAGQLYLTSGDLRYNSNAGFGIVTQNGARLVSIQNGALGVTGAATFSSGIGIGNATATTGGIQFPATEVNVNNANNLDDYEEGSFTPVVVGSSTPGTATYGAQNGRYVKIGRQVSFNLYCDWSAGTGTGSLRIGGLPYVADAAGIYPACAIGETSGIALSATGIMTARVQISDTVIFIGQYPLGGGSASSVNYDGTGYVVLSGTYYV